MHTALYLPHDLYATHGIRRCTRSRRTIYPSMHTALYLPHDLYATHGIRRCTRSRRTIYPSMHTALYLPHDLYATHGIRRCTRSRRITLALSGCCSFVSLCFRTCSNSFVLTSVLHGQRWWRIIRIPVQGGPDWRPLLQARQL